MSLGTALKTSALFCNPENLDLFKRHIDPAWIDAALSATGKASVRRRRLPAEQVIWVVLGMALFQGRSIEDVITKLDLALPGADTIAPSSIAQARKRLGKEPLQWLFNRCARVWSSRSAQAHTYKGLSLYGIDGTSFRVPDSPKNREHFGGQSGRDGSQSGYPLVRMAALMVLSSHVIADAKFGAFEGTQEQQYATGLLDKIPTDSLTILDRGFFGASFLKAIESVPGRQWLVRGKANMSVRVVKKLGPRDELVEFTTSHCALAKDPSLPSTFLARRVNYKKRGFDRVYLRNRLTADPLKSAAVRQAILLTSHA